MTSLWYVKFFDLLVRLCGLITFVVSYDSDSFEHYVTKSTETNYINIIR